MVAFRQRWTAINLETTEANFCSVTVATLELCQQIKYVLCSRTTERSQTHTHSIITHITLLLTATAKRTWIAGSPKFSSSCSGRELVLGGGCRGIHGSDLLPGHQGELHHLLWLRESQTELTTVLQSTEPCARQKPVTHLDHAPS